MNLDELKHELENNGAGRLYLFYGLEEYVKDYYLDLMERSVLGEEHPGFNKTVFSGKTALRDICEASQDAPMFSERRLILARTTGLFKSEDLSKADEDERYLSDIPQYACVVFIEEQVPLKSTLYHAVNRYGKAVEFKYLFPGSIVKWLKEETKKQGKTIENTAAAKMVEYCEPGLKSVSMELGKLMQYIGERQEITGDDIEHVTIRSVKSRIYDFTDAILAGDAPAALNTLDLLMSSNESLHFMLISLASHFRLLVRIRTLLDSGIRPDEKNVGIKTKPYPVKKGISQVRNVSVGQLERCMDLILNCDRSAKSGRIDEDTAIRILIGEITGIR